MLSPICLSVDLFHPLTELQRQKNSGGGGGGRGGRGHHRDFDNPNYGQPHSNPNAAGNPPAVQAPAGGDGQADPYAACEYYPQLHVIVVIPLTVM